MEESIKKLELALKLMQERSHDVAGLGAPIQLIKDVIGELNDVSEVSFKNSTSKLIQSYIKKYC